MDGFIIEDIDFSLGREATWGPERARMMWGMLGREKNARKGIL